ncbi:MAG: hypothetical protein HY321_22215 [Armatimonadetes bacterium]|nr:hypothetical protein [Armatimonadota bacterium]
MEFPPKPENDFAQYIRTYYDECRYRFPGIEAIAGKWMFRDLIPGMSDFDTRFIVRDDMTADDWCAMSVAIGEAHLELCRKYFCWARNLEHLPGVNLTWSELTSERQYYPEYRQWTYYHSENPARLTAALEALERRPWGVKDEYFHLKRFCLYFGRYNRTIDPAINLGVHEVKYPLHSRVMHYFSPPVMSAMCILEKRNIAGKFDSFEIAQRHFPRLGCWEALREILHAGYEAPRWYEEPLLSRLEDELEQALRVLAGALREVTTLVPPAAGLEIPAWKKALQEVPLDPALIIFDNAKFSRLMKGRLLFYARAPETFDTTWLIANELGRIGSSFFQVPFRTYWKIRSGESVADATTILDSLRGDPLTDAEVAATREFGRLTPGRWEPGTERELALAIAGVFDGFFRALSRISQSV